MRTAPPPPQKVAHCAAPPRHPYRVGWRGGDSAILRHLCATLKREVAHIGRFMTTMCRAR
jgi:hypothetical protein